MEHRVEAFTESRLTRLGFERNNVSLILARTLIGEIPSDSGRETIARSWRGHLLPRRHQRRESELVSEHQLSGECQNYLGLESRGEFSDAALSSRPP